MSAVPPGAAAQPPHAEPIIARCAGTYYANHHGKYAFIFRVPETNTEFTVYTTSGFRYRLGENYALSLTARDTIPLSLTFDDWQFLRRCLDTAAARWREATERANMATELPQPEPVAEQPGHLNVIPISAGHRAARMLRDELARVEQLNARLGDLLPAAEDIRHDGDWL